MPGPIERAAGTPVNAPAVLRPFLSLNNAHAAETSLLDQGMLRRMLAMAFRVETEADAAGLCALLLAFDQDAAYDSANFLWLRARHERFVYVDRVVVAAHARRRGLAAALYRRLFDAATAAGHDRVLCEVNLEPPNPGSDAFHAALGFREIGQATLPGKARRVRYLMRPLA